MEALLYLLKVSAGLVVLYGVYWLLLRQHTYFSANRLYLLCAIFLSLAAPFFEISERVPEVAATVSLDVNTVVVAVNPPTKQGLSLEEMLLFCYFLGATAMLVRLGKKLGLILLVIQLGQRQRVGKYVLVRTQNTQLSSFSFLHYLVLSVQDEATCADVVLRHETVHIKQRHSLDLLLLELVHVVFWFNPILIFYKNSLRQIHEFIADELATAGDRLTYARALVGYTFGVSPQVLTNNFFDSSQIKNRIIMLTKNRSSRWVLTRYLLALPVLGALVLLVAARTVEVIPAQLAEVRTEVPEAIEMPTVLANDPIGEKIVVKGTVYAKTDKLPLPSANIVVIGETKGTYTDANGAFIIETTTDKELAVSFVGYTTAIVSTKRMTGGAGVSVFLEKESKELPEVVVVGNEVATFTTTKKPETPPALPAIDSKDDKIFTVVEQQPEYVGGNAELMRFIGRNVKYPASAVRANVQGKVFVQFVVGKDGQISDITVLKSIGFGCDEEAVRVANIMPAWKPGQQNGQPVAVQYTLPIQFVLEGNSPKSGSKVIFSDKTGGLKLKEEPLWIIDGVEIKREGDKIDVKPEDIESMEILKGESAIKSYGEKGKNGVILIKTKKKANELKKN